jgi:hypothetical protein
MYTIQQESIPTITKREIFAISILQELVSAQPLHLQYISEQRRKTVANAIELADELLAQLEATSNNLKSETES